MKNSIGLVMGAALLLTSCGTYTATGAIVGGEFGHVVGSAIGGISGGWRGAHQGSLLGTVGGVIAGAAVGAAIDNAQQRKYESPANYNDYDDRVCEDCEYNDYSYDDRIDFDQNPVRSSSAGVPRHARAVSANSLPAIELRNARIYDSDNNGVLTRGEQCTVVFEIMNNGSTTVYDIMPLVEDVTGNKHVKVSPNLRVESIAPHHGIRYTASILADNSLKDGEIIVRVGVAHGLRKITSLSQTYTVPTRKKAPMR